MNETKVLREEWITINESLCNEYSWIKRATYTPGAKPKIQMVIEMTPEQFMDFFWE